jgi:hypothetical protein
VAACDETPGECVGGCGVASPVPGHDMESPAHHGAPPFVVGSPQSLRQGRAALILPVGSPNRHRW